MSYWRKSLLVLMCVILCGREKVAGGLLVPNQMITTSQILEVKVVGLRYVRMVCAFGGEE
jgi:hypothetical protein